MSSYYDPPEDGPGTIAGPSWYVTTHADHGDTEQVIYDLEFATEGSTNWAKDKAKEGYEVFIRYGYIWNAPGEDEWYYEQSYDDASAACGDAYMQNEEDARDAMVDAAMEARYDRD